MGAKFAVIITNYNRAKYLPDAIESVVQQTFKAWELIIVDDCSTDNSIKIIKNYAGKDKRIKYVKHDANKGFAAALRTGVENIKAPYFGTLDSDDALDKDAIKVMYEEHLKNPDCSMLYSQHTWCDDKLNVERPGFCAPLPYGSEMESGKLISQWRTFNKFYYDQTPGYDEKLKRAVDKDIIYRMEEVGRLLFVDKPLYYIRVHSGETLSQGKMLDVARKVHAGIRSEAIERRTTFAKKCPVLVGNKAMFSDNQDGDLPPISLILPFKNSNDERSRILEWSIERYKKVFPEFEIVVEENNDVLFNKSKAINAAVERASHDILCMCDIDALYDRRLVVNALPLLGKTGCVKVPECNGAFGTGCLALREECTEQLFNSKIPLVNIELTYDWRNIANHFALVTKETFYSAGGYDEGFKGWGCEDNAFFKAMEIMSGPFEPINWPVYHLWHTLSPEQALTRGVHKKTSQNWKLWYKYRDAKTKSEIRAINKNSLVANNKHKDSVIKPINADSIGRFFDVYLYDDLVVKIPKKPAVEDHSRLEFIANTQTELSQHVPEVLPCYKIGKSLVMPRAPGVTLDQVPKRARRIEALKADALTRIKQRGYLLRDSNKKDVLYDARENRIYLVDFHNVKRA